MAKLPNPPRQEDFEAPTLKRNVPAELRDPNAPAYVTTKLRKAEIEQLLQKDQRDREKSGMRPAVSDEDIERFERREQRETLPAPPDPVVDSAFDPASTHVAALVPPQLPEEVADLDSGRATTEVRALGGRSAPDENASAEGAASKR